MSGFPDSAIPSTRKLGIFLHVVTDVTTNLIEFPRLRILRLKVYKNAAPIPASRSSAQYASPPPAPSMTTGRPSDSFTNSTKLRNPRAAVPDKPDKSMEPRKKTSILFC